MKDKSNEERVGGREGGCRNGWVKEGRQVQRKKKRWKEKSVKVFESS